MSSHLELFVSPAFFDTRKKLVITDEYLEYDNQNFSKLEIAEFKYGVASISGYMFRIGRIYSIDIKNTEQKIIKIRLKSIYRINLKTIEEKYFKILNELNKKFINDISNNYFQMFLNKIDFIILGTTFSQQGITFDKKQSIIAWSNAGYKEYTYYFSLFSKLNANQNKLFYYRLDWNAIVIKQVSKAIFKYKKLQSI